jgi:hypothetical protein
MREQGANSQNQMAKKGHETQTIRGLTHKYFNWPALILSLSLSLSRLLARSTIYALCHIFPMSQGGCTSIANRLALSKVTEYPDRMPPCQGEYLWKITTHNFLTKLILIKLTDLCS